MFSNTSLMVTGLLAALVLVSRYVWFPWRKAQRRKKLLDLIDNHCSLELVRALSSCREEDGKLNLPKEAIPILNNIYGFMVVGEAIKAVNDRKTEILILDPRGWRRRKRHREFLEVMFNYEGGITRAEFYPVFSAGKMGL